MKFQPQAAARADHIACRGAGRKAGGKDRPVTTLEQRQVLEHVMRLVSGSGSLIPAQMSYVEHLKRFEYQTLKAGLRNTHGFARLCAATLCDAGRSVLPAGRRKRWADMSGNERAADRAARHRISPNSAMARLKITDTYLGSAF